MLLAHFFQFLPRDFKKLTQNGLFLIHSKFGQLVWVFWSPWTKIKESEIITLKPWEFWSSCNKPHENQFRTLPYVCSSPQKYTCVTTTNTGLYFFMVRNKPRAEFRTDFYAVYCKSFRILRASGLLAHFFYFCSGT